MARWLMVAGGVLLALACGGSTDGDTTHTGGAGGAAGGGAGGSGSGPGGYGGGTCFAAGTPIATPRGDVSIEALGAGDIVLAYDENARAVVAAPVVRVFRHDGQRVGHLRLSGGRALAVTGNHPVFRPDLGDYVEAERLSRDTRLLALRGQSTESAILDEFSPDDATVQTVFNIEVATHHNYFAGGVLVHNKSGGAPPCSYEEKTIDYAATCDPTLPCITAIATSAGGSGGTGGGGGVGAAGGGGLGAAGSGGAGAAPDAGIAGNDGGSAPPDAGSDAAEADGGGLGARSEQRAICNGPLPQASHAIAFELWSDAPEPEVSVVANEVAGSCGGPELGHLWLPAGTGTWQSICTVIGPAWLYGTMELAVVAAGPNDQVRNLEFVESCAAPAKLWHWYGCSSCYTDNTGCK